MITKGAIIGTIKAAGAEEEGCDLLTLLNHYGPETNADMARHLQDLFDDEILIYRGKRNPNFPFHLEYRILVNPLNRAVAAGIQAKDRPKVSYRDLYRSKVTT